MTKRHLRDLYVRGTLVTIVDPGAAALVQEGDSEEEGPPTAVVFMKKLNTAENEEAVRRANAKRALVLSKKNDPESDIYLACMAEIDDMDRDALIEFLIAEDLQKKIDAVESELAEEDEWSKEGYLQGLQDAWAEDLSDVWVKAATDTEDAERDPKADEADRVYEELKRFRDKVEVQVEGHANYLRRDFEDVDEEALRTKGVQRYLKIRGDIAWLDEYRKSELFLAARDPENHREQYFDNRAEVDELELPVLLELMSAMRDLSVEVQEGKDLQATPSS